MLFYFSFDCGFVICPKYILYIFLNLFFIVILFCTENISLLCFYVLLLFYVSSLLSISSVNLNVQTVSNPYIIKCNWC